MKKIIAILLLINSLVVVGQNKLSLVPMPVSANIQVNVATKFIVSNATVVSYNSLLLKKDVLYFIKEIKKNYGVTLTSKFEPLNLKLVQKVKANTITITLLNSIYKNNNGDEFYNILSTSNSMQIIVNHPKGLFYSIQTLNQVLEYSADKKAEMPLVNINDYPRFAYRGMHLDVARHFYPVSFVKKYIDYLAAYKFNTFHWHLTDDQGWRIEIKKYPKLTQAGGFRNGTIIGRYPGKGNDSIHYGGFYTQAQIKEVVQYAADKYITVIPEIEMPGHASAAIAAYPQLSCFPNEDTQVPKGCTWSGSTKGKQVQQTWGVFEDVFAPTDYTFNFLQDVLDEVMTLFPSKYIHIGGDECPKEAWKRSDFCQQLLKEKNLKDEHELQSYFINRIEKYLNSKGRNIIGWDEILEGGLAPNATVMSWRGEAGGIEAAKQHHNVIMTPGKPVYFDHSQSKNEDSVTIGGYNSLEAVYNYNPIPKELNEEQAIYILGAQANMWTEYIGNTNKLEYMLFPRIAALSEVLWTSKEKRSWTDFERRIPILFERLDKQKINYSKAYYDLKATVLPTENNEGVKIVLESNFKNADIRYRYNNSNFNNYTQPVQLGKDVELSYSQFLNNQPIKISAQKFSFNKATGKKITLATEASKSYPGDGAFTLVNGVQNEKGLAKSSEFLGFLGKDVEATIDFGKDVEISKITLHTLNQNGSWIYLPKEIEISFIPYVDTTVITRHPPIETITQKVTDENNLQTIKLSELKTCRYLKVVAKNYGIIPSGNPGAGNPAWLFIDEIEVE